MQKRIMAIIVFLVAIVCAISTIWSNQFVTKCLLWGACVFLIVVGAWLLWKSFEKIHRSSIRRLVLINNDGEHDKEWAMGEATALLIGKGSRVHYVDIDLGDHRYEAFVSDEHAILNRMGEDWYIEDLSTVNGVGIKKYGQDMNYRIQPNRPYKIEVGDILYIAKIRLLAK